MTVHQRNLKTGTFYKSQYTEHCETIYLGSYSSRGEAVTAVEEYKSRRKKLKIE